jgi:aerobic C4-dicarboxylate transport protein
LSVSDWVRCFPCRAEIPTSSCRISALSSSGWGGFSSSRWFFFSAVVATDELRDDDKLLRTGLSVLGALVLVLVVAATIGAVSVMALQPQRIPPMVQEGRIGAAPGVISRLLETIPANSFRLFVAGENALLMIVLFGMIIGFTLRYDREITSPVSLVADSANRILFRLNSAMTGIVGFFLTIPTAMMVVLIRQTRDLALFGQFMLVVSSAALLLGIVVYPAALYFLDREHSRPLAWLRRMVPPGLAALAAGDVYFALATYSRVANEDLAVPRRIGGVVPPLMAVFGRAGTALVSVAAFILVIRSYTALEIGFVAVVQLTGAGVVYSLLLGRTPAGAVLLLLSLSCGTVREGNGRVVPDPAAGHAPPRADRCVARHDDRRLRLPGGDAARGVLFPVERPGGHEASDPIRQRTRRPYLSIVSSRKGTPSMRPQML